MEYKPIAEESSHDSKKKIEIIEIETLADPNSENEAVFYSLSVVIRSRLLIGWLAFVTSLSLTIFGDYVTLKKT